MGLEAIYLNVIKAMYDKPTASIILWAKTTSVPLTIRNKTGMSALTSLIQHSTGSPSHSYQTRRNKRHLIGKEEVKLAFAGDMVLYMRTPKIPPRNY